MPPGPEGRREGRALPRSGAFRGTGIAILFGIAAALKTVPLIMLPALLPAGRRPRRETGAGEASDDASVRTPSEPSPSPWMRSLHGNLLVGGLVSAGVVALTSLLFFLRNPESWDLFRVQNFGSSLPTMAGGNYSLLFLVLLGTAILGLPLGPEAFDATATVLRIVVLVGTAALVLLLRGSVLLSAGVLLLAHFVSYGHVWEHHLSAVVVAGCWMLVGLAGRASRWAVGGCLIALALPTPWPLLDVAKDPAVFDPSRDWPMATVAGVTAAKVLPTVLLYAIGCGGLLSSARRRDPVSSDPASGDPGAG
jgi:hypothetical protein